LLFTVFALPDVASGTGIVLRRLVENLDPDEAVLLGRGASRRWRLDREPLSLPSIRVRWVSYGLRGERFSRLTGVLPAVVQGHAAVRRHGCGAILAMYPDEGSLLTGYLLHRITRLPLMLYFCDLYMEEWRGDGWESRMARWLQPRAFRDAARLFAVNQGLAEFYRERYGIDAVTLPTCINRPIPPFEPPPPPGRPLRIAYSGNVYSARIDSLRALVAVVGGDPAFALHYFTPQKPEYLKSLGVWCDNATAEFVADESALIARLRECDVMFLPLTFSVEEHAREQLATCFGVKAYEYFLAGRPVLVHCPGDYFLARFFRERACGVVVEDPSPQALAAGLARLRDGGSLRADLVRNGLEAVRQFEGRRVAATLRAEFAAVLRAAGEGERT